MYPRALFNNRVQYTLLVHMQDTVHVLNVGYVGIPGKMRKQQRGEGDETM